MLTGQIGLLRNGNTFITRGIEWATYSHAHHVIVAISETQCVSAEPGGVRIRDISEYGHVDWSRFDLTKYERFNIYVNAIKSLKLPYNYAIYPFLLAARITGVLVPDWIAAWLSKRRNVDCSQLVDDVYNKAGIDLFTAANVLTTPGDFDRYFMHQGWLNQDKVSA
jgi:hypothetical protein